MTRICKAKYKKARQLLCNLFGREDKYERKYLPGQHGLTVARSRSNYSKQLRAKQMIKWYYDITERHLRKMYKEADRMKGNSGENLVGLLERHLAMVVYRMKLAASIYAARQLVSHGHIRLNGKKINIATAMVSPGDTIELSEKTKEKTSLGAMAKENIAKKDRDIPTYIEMNEDKLSAVFVRVPQTDEVPYPVVMEPQLIIEFYSK